MTSLRRYVLVGAVLWTLGLLAVWAVLLTLHHELFQFLAVIHGYPHTLMVAAILAMAAGFATVRRGLLPLDEMRRRLAEIRNGATTRLVGRFPSEVEPLVSDLNALLAHQEAAVSRARAKAGDLAHGLKTPLAILAQDADRAELRGQSELAAAMREQIERMRRQIEYHLAQARAAASGSTPGARTAVAASGEALARTLHRLHAERHLIIDVRADPGVEVRCERADLDEMLGNVLDNACRFARSRVTLTAAADGATATICVDDDGPGIDPSLRNAVLQRGVRADQAAPGSGLGLAIVRDLADLYGGGIALEEAPLGGLRARLTLPAA